MNRVREPIEKAFVLRDKDKGRFIKNNHAHVTVNLLLSLVFLAEGKSVRYMGKGVMLSYSVILKTMYVITARDCYSVACNPWN